MVLAWHGGRLADQPAATGFANGATLADLVELAERSGLQPRAVRAGLDDLRRLRLPAILHWDMDHFVVLAAVKRRGLLLHDPARGRRLVSLSESDRAFTGVALELTPAVDFSRTPAEKRAGLLTFLGHFRFLPRYLGLMLLLLLATQLLGLAPAVAAQLLIDQVVLAQDAGWTWRLIAVAGLVLLSAAVLDTWRRMLALESGTRLAFDSSTCVVRHLLSLPADYFARRHAGDVLSRLRSLEPIRQAGTEDLVQAVAQGSVLATTLAVMLFYSPMLTAVAVSGVVATFLLTAAFLPARRRLTAESLAERAREDSSLLHTLHGIAPLRAAALVARRMDDWQRHHSRATNAMARQGRLTICAGLGVQLAAAAEQLAFLGFGVGAVAGQKTTLGVLFAFMSLRARLGTAVMSLADLSARLYLVRAHQERLADITLQRPEPAADGRGVCRRMRGHLRIRGLRFGWADRSPPLFDGFDLDVAPGEHVAVSGPSGSGKSTLLGLIGGQLTPDAGHISIDGIERDLWQHRSLTDQLAVVLQDDLLFEGSIADNLCGFALRPDDARMREIAEAVGLWAAIRRLPMRQDTRVSDAVRLLSGGERQRIILARAIYRRPRLLLLDEATRSLDASTEARVLDAVDALGCTVLHVTHRPSAEMRAGRRIELGRPA